MIIGVVIPCFRVKAHILEVINNIGPEVAKIYVVDDFCPEGTGKFLEESCSDIRIQVIYHQNNQGVG
jgi:dolichol-phosphate mannosyltransferase